MSSSPSFRRPGTGNSGHGSSSRCSPVRWSAVSRARTSRYITRILYYRTPIRPAGNRHGRRAAALFPLRRAGDAGKPLLRRVCGRGASLLLRRLPGGCATRARPRARPLLRVSKWRGKGARCERARLGRVRSRGLSASLDAPGGGWIAIGEPAARGHSLCRLLVAHR